MLQRSPTSVSAAAIESFLGLNPQTLNTLAAVNFLETPAVNGSALKQTVTVNEGDVLSLNWNFATQDVGGYDFAFVVVAGIAQVLAEHLSEMPPMPEEERHEQLALPIAQRPIGDICPECGEAAFLNIEGCRKCATCGYSEC